MDSIPVSFFLWCTLGAWLSRGGKVPALRTRDAYWGLGIGACYGRRVTGFGTPPPPGMFIGLLGGPIIAGRNVSAFFNDAIVVY